MTLNWNDPVAIAALADQLDAEDEARRQRLARAEALAEAAFWYGSVGVAVFPLVVGGKRPLTTHGLHDATTDLEQIRAWWEHWPQANIAFRTGISFDVIDVDVDHDDPAKPNGYFAIAELRRNGALPDILGYAVTPRGGMHVYVPVSGRGNKAGLYPGVDYRGDGGYVVAPPSVGANGRQWTWTTPVDFKALHG